MRTDKRILLVSSIIFAALAVLAILLGDIAVSINLIFIGVIILTVPFSIYRFLQFKKVKSYEREFPNLLRDIAKSQRAGLTFVQAIQVSSKSEYGALTSEVNKLNKQLSWNVPLEKVLEKFGERMVDSRIIVRSLMVIDQANKSGGNIEDTMDSLASSIESIREAQEEKSAVLNQQVVMMYAIFFIFVGITISLIKFLVPLLQTEGLGGGGLGLEMFNANPCAVCAASPDPACFGCQTFFGMSTAFGFGKPSEPMSYYKSLFLTMILIQGFFSGLIAGQISSDSVTAGTKHSLVMVFSGFAIFIIVTTLGLV